MFRLGGFTYQGVLPLSPGQSLLRFAMASLMHREFPTLSGRGQYQNSRERSQPEMISRPAYQMCHVDLPDHPRPVAAIAYNGHYYSLFKARQPLGEAQAMAERLYDQNEQVVMTELPTGYAVWVLEPDADSRSTLTPSSSAAIATEPHHRGDPSTPMVPLLQAAYVPCHVRVPERSDRLSAIRIDEDYYSLFRMVTRPHQAIQIRDKLSDRGHQVVVTQMIRGYALWVLEPAARLEPPSASG